MKKKISLIVTAVALATLMIVGGTLAWFTDSETVTNRITTGKVDIVLTEPAFDEISTTVGDVKTVGNVTPGAVIPKDPTVTNNAESSVFVRIKLSYEGTTLSLKDATSCLNISSDWTLMNGFYYYKAAIKANEKTTPLFTKVSIPSNLTNADMEKLVNIKIDAEAIQSDNILPAGYAGTTPAFDAFAKN